MTEENNAQVTVEESGVEAVAKKEKPVTLEPLSNKPDFFGRKIFEKSPIRTRPNSVSPEEPVAKEEPAAPAAAPETPAAPEKKQVLLKAGEKEIPLEEDALVPVKVDGKLMEVPLSELRKHYSGQTNWDLKFQDLAEKRKQLEAQAATYKDVDSKFQPLVEKIKQGDALAAFSEFVNTYFQGNSAQVESKLLEQMVPKVQSYLEMDPTQRESVAKETEVQYLKRQLEQVKAAEQAKLEQAQKQQQLQSFLSSQGTSLQEVQEEWAKINANPGAYLSAEDRQKLARANESQKLQFVVDSININKTLNKIETVLDRVNPKLKEDREGMAEIYAQAVARGLDESGIENFARKLYGNLKAEPEKKPEAVEQVSLDSEEYVPVGKRLKKKALLFSDFKQVYTGRPRG